MSNTLRDEIADILEAMDGDDFDNVAGAILDRLNNPNTDDVDRAAKAGFEADGLGGYWDEASEDTQADCRSDFREALSAYLLGDDE